MKSKVNKKSKKGRRLIALLAVLLLLGIVLGAYYRNQAPSKSSKLTTSQSEKAVESRQSQQNTKITFIYADHNLTTTPSLIASWYAPKGGSNKLSDAQITASIKQIGAGFGIDVDNLDQAVYAAKNAVLNQAPAQVVLNAKNVTKTFTYCALLRGVDSTYLPNFIDTLAEVYSDPRGWSLGGQVRFTRVDQGCNFSIWLTAADQMPSFGGVCDSDWSCRSGDNVVINFNRWRFSSPSWVASGNNLHDYRVLTINHETGHWFGFNHLACPADGTPAPVMMQQSIDLGGCKFNWWPLPTELTALRSILGL